MYCPVIHILSKRKELAFKYKKIVESLNCTASIFSKLDEAIFAIKNDEPEIIIVSDTIEDTLSDFVKKIRVLTYNFRPVIIAISKSDAVDDKLSALEAGADDFLDESITSKEFKARINAHIRRYLENSIDPVTNFIDKKVTQKALKRLVKTNENKAVMLIDVYGIDFYREIYGEIACEKVLQTLAAIINSTLQNDDIAGHCSKNEFMLITSSLKAEKIAKFLTFAFDNILERFYTEFDFKNNFMLYSSDAIEEKKIPLMKLSVSIAQTENGKFENEKQLLSLLLNVLKLTRTSEKSSYIMDRPKLSGEVSKINPKNKVMIMESDDALNCLLDVTLAMQGYTTRACSSYDDFMDEFSSFAPDVLILDYGSEQKKQGFKILDLIKKTGKTPPKIIFSTVIRDKKIILSKGADFYLPKPYDITTLINWVKKLI